MFNDLFSKAVPMFQDAIYHYAAEIIKTEEIPKKYKILKVIWDLKKRSVVSAT